MDRTQKPKLLHVQLATREQLHWIYYIVIMNKNFTIGFYCMPRTNKQKILLIKIYDIVQILSKYLTKIWQHYNKKNSILKLNEEKKILQKKWSRIYLIWF